MIMDLINSGNINSKRFDKIKNIFISDMLEHFKNDVEKSAIELFKEMTQNIPFEEFKEYATYKHFHGLLGYKDLIIRKKYTIHTNEYEIWVIYDLYRFTYGMCRGNFDFSSLD